MKDLNETPPVDLDLEAFVEKTGLDRDEYLEIYALFKETYETLMKDLEEALARGDKFEAMRAAHTLKGAASNLGFTALAETARRIQESPEDMAGAAAAVKEIHSIYASLDQKVQAFALH